MSRFLDCAKFIEKEISTALALPLCPEIVVSRVSHDLEPARWTKFQQGLKRALLLRHTKQWGPCNILADLDRIASLLTFCAERIDPEAVTQAAAVAVEIGQFIEVWLGAVIETPSPAEVLEANSSDSSCLPQLVDALEMCGLSDVVQILAMLPVYTEIACDLVANNTSTKKHTCEAMGAVLEAAAYSVFQQCLIALTDRHLVELNLQQEFKLYIIAPANAEEGAEAAAE